MSQHMQIAFKLNTIRTPNQQFRLFMCSSPDNNNYAALIYIESTKLTLKHHKYIIIISDTAEVKSQN